jgi:hypothetical protein
MEIEIIKSDGTPVRHGDINNYEINGNYLRLIFNSKSDGDTTLEHSKVFDMKEIKNFNIINENKKINLND